MESREPTGGEIIVNGVRLHYLDWGGTGAPIFVLHATGLLGRVYRPIAAALSAAGHVFSYDQRGHGDSGKPAEAAYNWYETMQDLAALIGAMGLEGVRGFGHSAGATAIGSLASLRPDLISRAVLVEPVVFTSPAAPEAAWRNPFVERTLKRRRVFDSVAAMFANFDRKPPYHSWRKDMLHDYCEYGTRPTPEGRRELKCDPEIEARLYTTSQEFDGLSRILACEAPLLVLFGDRSDSLGHILADQTAAGLRNKASKVIRLRQAGHFAPMEQPDEVARLAVEFLSEQ